MAADASPRSVRARARALVDELNDFTTAPAALQWLFDNGDDDERLRVAELLLHWQNRTAHDPVDAVAADFDAHDDAVMDVIHIHRDMLLLVMGKPALLFAASIYDEDLAMLVWRGLLHIQQAHPDFNLLLQAMDNTRDGHGLSSLHYAVEAQMNGFFRDVCSHLVRQDREKLRRALAAIRAQDVVLPMGAKQITGRSITSGGCTLLHLAARKGELELVQRLVEEPVALDVGAAGTDWDGLSALELARLHRRLDVADYLCTKSSSPKGVEKDIEAMQARRDLCATMRYAESMVASEPMTRREVFTGVWSHGECEHVMRVLEDVTSRRGWSKQRHTSYPTTDIPCYQVAPIDAWVRSAIKERLFTQVYERYGIPPTKTLTFRELFFVKYEARSGEQAELPLHRDGSVLSFNILLNPSEEFTGGGTYFEEASVTVHIEQGDAVVHSGKVRHAGAVVTQGRRTILVGFLDLVDRVGL